MAKKKDRRNLKAKPGINYEYSIGMMAHLFFPTPLLFDNK